MPKNLKAMYAGTFDPFTNGHFDLLKRSLYLFDHVTILLAVSQNKKPLFSLEERVEMLEKLFAKEKKVSVDSWQGLLVDYAKKNNIGTVIRGLRPAGDFDFEFQMAAMNNKLCPQLETIFMMTRGEHYFVSSTSVREILNCRGNISAFVPGPVNEYIKKLRTNK
ncbi:MAG: pantetheine-phosphate adenylyltransferase [Pseudomonadota bacterium]